MIELLIPLFEEDENEVENQQLEQEINGMQIELISIVMEKLEFSLCFFYFRKVIVT